MTAPGSGTALSRSEPVTFGWTSVTGAVAYGFEYTGPNRQFANPGGTEPDPVNGFGGAGGGFLLPSTSFTVVLGTGVPAGTYEVRVIAVGPTGALLGTFSPALTVTVPATSPPTSVAPKITAPADGATLSRTHPVTFKWTSVTGAATYGFEFTGPDLEFANPGDTEPDPVNGFGGAGGEVFVHATSLTTTLDPAVPAGSYQVRVIAIGSNGQVIGHNSNAITVTVPPSAVTSPGPPGDGPEPPGDEDDD
jgi:hypothetical protein